jgi:hypothetical protein
MNKTFPPRTFPDIPVDSAELLVLFKGARAALLCRRRTYICHAVASVALGLGYKDPARTAAHEIIDHRLGFAGLSGRHTYISWWRAQNNNTYPIDDQALRIRWLDDLIKEFSE